VGEELPADVQLALTPAQGAESQTGQTASLFEEPSFSRHERKIYGVLKAGEPCTGTKSWLSCCEILAAWFELELAGTVKQLPGKKLRELLVIRA